MLYVVFHKKLNYFTIILLYTFLYNISSFSLIEKTQH